MGKRSPKTPPLDYGYQKDKINKRCEDKNGRFILQNTFSNESMQKVKDGIKKKVD